MKRGAFLALIIGGLLLPMVATAGVETTPYGFILLNASYNTRSQTDVPVLAAPAGKGEPNFNIFARQSRLGLKMKSDATYTPSAGLELDFYGLRGSGSNGGPTNAAPRLRRAFMEMHFSKFDLLAGQEWIVCAPLNPTTIMHMSLTGEMSSGNLWARLPQIRGTMKPISSETGELKVDLALVRPLGADAPMDAVTVGVVADTTTGIGTGNGTGGVSQGEAYGRGEQFGWPWAQGRLGYTVKGATKVAAGVSGHYGMMDFGNDPAGDDLTGVSMAVAGDLQITVGKATISGEGFWGQNINTLFSNAKFAMVPDSMKVDNVQKRFKNVEEITATGGWGEVKYAVSPAFDLVINGGVEQMDDEFLAAPDVKSNTTIMGMVIAKPTAGVQIGLETGMITTTFMGNDPGTADKETEYDRSNMNVNVSFMYSF